MDSIDTRETLFATVLLPLNLHRPFTYRIPFDLNAEAVIGKRVIVPFGKNKTYTGVIIEVHTLPPKVYEAKYILEFLDDVPSVTDTQLQFWRWISTYYLCSLGLVLQAALPAGLKLEGESKLVLHPDFSWDSHAFDERELQILQLLEIQKELSIKELTKVLRLPSIHGLIKSLYLKTAILVKEEVKQAYKTKKVTYLSLANEFKGEDEMNKLFTTLEKRAVKQLEAIMLFIAENGIVQDLKQTLLLAKGASANALRALITKGVLLRKEVEESRLKEIQPHQDLPELNPIQEKALDQIEISFTENKTALLHGVTSSGKTMLYVHLIKKQLDEGKQVLYLLPEIALTSQLLDRLAAVFGDRMLSSHSKFNTNERVEVYLKILKGGPMLILGTRSAIFHPFQKLGLVVVDEEHESSFKQYEPAPRFHARDAALYLATLHGAKVILGSATPSFESYNNAISGKYQLIELHERYDKAILPKVEIIDMQVQKRQKRTQGIFSDTLLEALKQAKSEGKQSILFQNKKGYVPVLECTQCSWTPQCVNCDISLTYYKYQNNMRCHYCGYTRPVVSQCGACGHQALELIGYGTERIEDELNLYAPNLIVQRLDYNTTRQKTAHKKIIDRFAKGEIDVLVGTQMVAKGLDFDHVKLVGIVNADHLLNFPDFRAHERAFGLMTQVAGRAGRRAEQGIVYIQSSKADHHLLQHVINHDYRSMYQDEISERNQFAYPPSNRLLRITVKHKDALKLHKASEQTANVLKQAFGNLILGPEKPHVGKIRNWYIIHFLLKLENNTSKTRSDKNKLVKAIGSLEQMDVCKGVRFTLDVDPY